LRLFLDTEFNGFGGKLMSMALVPEDDRLSHFYCEIEMTDQLHPWVREHVVPHMTQSPVTYSVFQQQLSQYLLRIGDCTIIADWPDDIRYFCEAVIVGPGDRMPLPTNITFDLNLNINYSSEVRHNAYWDACGIRDYYRNTVAVQEKFVEDLKNGVRSVVINNCYGGFGLSDTAISEYKKLAGITDPDWYDRTVARDDPYLVKIVRELGATANGGYADLKIVEIPGDVKWCINEYDGNEWIAEEHRTWS